MQFNLLPALLRKAQALERLGRLVEAGTLYRALLATTPSMDGLPEPVRQALGHGRELLATLAEQRIKAWEGPLSAVHVPRCRSVGGRSNSADLRSDVACSPGAPALPTRRAQRRHAHLR